MKFTEQDLQKATWTDGTPENLMGFALIWGTQDDASYYVAVHVRANPEHPEKLLASRSFLTRTDCIEDVLADAREKHECDILRVDQQEGLLDYIGGLAQMYATLCAKQATPLQNTPAKQNLWQKLLSYFA